MWSIVGNYLKIKRMNQSDLAKKMNVSTGVISDLKMGRIKKPSFDLVCKLADALEIKVDDLRN